MALEAARAGAGLLKEAGLPRPGGEAALKGRGDYVTESDRQSEAVIIERLQRLAPGIAILAEVGGVLPPPSRAGQSPSYRATPLAGWSRAT